MREKCALVLDTKYEQLSCPSETSRFQIRRSTHFNLCSLNSKPTATLRKSPPRTKKHTVLVRDLCSPALQGTRSAGTWSRYGPQQWRPPRGSISCLARWVSSRARSTQPTPARLASRQRCHRLPPFPLTWKLCTQLTPSHQTVPAATTKTKNVASCFRV